MYSIPGMTLTLEFPFIWCWLQLNRNEIWTFSSGFTASSLHIHHNTTEIYLRATRYMNVGLAIWLTLWCSVFLDKLAVAHLILKLPVFSGTRGFFTTFTPSSARWIQSTRVHSVFLRFLTVAWVPCHHSITALVCGQITFGKQWLTSDNGGASSLAVWCGDEYSQSVR